MDRKDVRRKHSYTFSRLQKLLVMIILAYAAVSIGMFGGTFISKIDFKSAKFDTSFFKTVVNQSWPLIDTVYNSGKIKASISYEIEKLINSIFSFNLNKPLTVLNAQSSMFTNYYVKIYEPNNNVARNDIGETPFIDNAPYTPDGSNTIIPDQNGDSGQTPENETNPDNETQKPDTDPANNGKVIVRNDTKIKVDVEALAKEPLKLNFDKKNPQVLIYHTHNEEGYLKSLTDLKNTSYPATTEDERYNVISVGEELKKSLEKLDIGVLHNGTDHRYPTSNDRYTNSMNTVNSILKAYPSIKILFDIHRDGLPVSKGKLRAVTAVNGKNAAKIMFVVTNGSYGYTHPNWKENMKLAIKLQQKLIDQNPGLVKPIYLVGYRYNEQLSPGSLVVEIGGDGNTAEEAAESAKYLANALADVINGK